ncbi:hypothetical protein K8375_09865 [Weissella cibaria]|jgi:hypothetical protein|uniref:hypothetical protein n=1 Tax=Weissella TaxID=46255 RepID=UPI0018F22DCF|nr:MULTISPECIES: hypothetical protein [Weissella]MBJ7671188.1 hypothetical protein [Weissella confusa]MBZ6070356.1 hypothetical protein [Weissella cibaria]
MRAIITPKQQTKLLQLAGRMRLSRKALADELDISGPTMRRVLDSEAPVVVTSKVFTSVNDFLLENLGE